MYNILYHLHCVFCTYINYVYVHILTHVLHFYRLNVVSLCTLLTPAFSVSLELQGDCSDQITLICRHSDVLIDPNWIHNETLESGDVLATAFPGAMYTVQTLTEHTTTITGVDTVRALDGYVIQCAYTNLGNLIKSNAVQFSFIPTGQCMCCIQNTFHDVFTWTVYARASTTGSVQPCTPHRAGPNWPLVIFTSWWSLCIGGLQLWYPTVPCTSAVQIAIY